MTHRFWARYVLGLLVALILLFSAGWVMAQGDAAGAAPNVALLTALRHTHSLVRWIVVVVAIVALAKLALGLVQKSSYDTLTRRILVIFSGVTTLQWVIGLAFLIVLGGITGFGIRHYWEHLFVMTVALGLSHMHNSKRWRDKADDIRYRNALIVVVAVIVLVVIGVALLPQGWRLFPPA
jgi:hypothetical protein